MNNARRKQLQDVTDRLTAAAEDLEIVKDEEQEAFDNLPETFQDGERGEAMENALSLMEEALDNIRTAIEQTEEARD